MVEIFNNNDPEKENRIQRIIQKEWDMFQDVENIGGRASCQDDWETFHIMRYSQAAMMDDATLRHYEEDLKNASEAGRNLIMEKYAYMMEFTDRDYYEKNLKAHLPVISTEKAELIETISSIMLRSEKEFCQKHPRFAQKERPLTSTDTDLTPFYAYLVGELKTYSEATLESLCHLVDRMESSGKSTAETIHGNVVRLYGYDSIQKAEATME
ncbi:MAG: DUF4125 family protein [Firmicutes bacterium]|jgi:hypothetical protein|nr:DUF4125 family protein [Bacillota bacterium]